MPSILHHLVPSELEKYRSSTSFILRFPHDTQNGIFYSLIAFPFPTTITFLMLGSWLFNHVVCLSRNCVVFSVPGFAGRVTLIDSYTFYEVHIRTPVEQPKLCLYFRDAMITGLEKAAANLHYTNSNPVIAFPAPAVRESSTPPL